MVRWIGVAGFVGFLGISSAQADVPLRVDQSAERMRVDGALREWQGARFAELGSRDSGLRYALAVADAGLYIGAEVADSALVRTKGLGAGQDALVLTFAMPDGRGAQVSTEVWLHPGEAGKSKALAGLRKGTGALKQEAKISVVEGPRTDGKPGYVLEAFVPWTLIEGAEIWEQGRAGLRLENQDPGAARASVLATSQAKPPELPRIALGEGHKDFLGSFLANQNLVGVEPRFDFRGNVSGNATPERVVIIDKFALVYGPGYQNGESFGFLTLPVGGVGGGIKQAELSDLDGDGVSELLLTLRQSNAQGARDVWMVYSFAESQPRALGGVELRKEASSGFIENSLKIERGKGKTPPHVVLKLERSQNISADNYREASATDVQPILLPWGDVTARSYALRDKTLVMIAEERAPKAKTAVSAGAGAPARGVEGPLEVAVEPTLDAVLSLFRRDRKLPAKLAPRRHQRANVLGGPTPEELFELGNHIVLVGQDIDEGASYLAYGLPVKDPSEILYVGHIDVTGDGHEEIFVRIVQPLSGADGVHREVALVLSVEARGRFRRLLAAEVVRRQGERVIVNRVNTKGSVLAIEPGSAEGWSQSDYPFASDATGGVSRLLLPWQDVVQRYRLQGDALVAEP